MSAAWRQPLLGVGRTRLTRLPIRWKTPMATMKSKRVDERAHRVAEWRELKRAPRSDDCHCAVCYSQYKEIREYFEDCGDICLGCYVENKKCSEPGCDRMMVARTGGLCRHHYLGEPMGDEEIREFTLQNQCYHKGEPIYPATPGSMWGAREMRQKLSDFHKKAGIKTKMNPFWNSPIYYRKKTND